MGCAVNGPGRRATPTSASPAAATSASSTRTAACSRRCRSDILIDELFFEIDRWIAGGHAAPEAPEDGQAGRARDGRSLADPARLDFSPMIAPRFTAASCRPCATTPADAEALSHKLLVRGGFIRQVSAGLWTFLPLGWRVHRKVEQVDPRGDGRDRRAGDVRARADAGRALGCKSGRYGIPELFKLQDRNGRDYVLPLTHEETFAVPRAWSSELPAAAAVLVPLPDEGPRRAASPRRPARASASSS